MKTLFPICLNYIKIFTIAIVSNYLLNKKLLLLLTVVIQKQRVYHGTCLHGKENHLLKQRKLNQYKQYETWFMKSRII